MKWLENVGNLFVSDSLYDRILEHVDVMNSWKEDQDLIEKYPNLNRDFTVNDALFDLLAKGVIHE